MKNSKNTRIYVQLSHKEYYLQNLFGLFVYSLYLFLFICFQILFAKLNIHNMNTVELKYVYVWLISFGFDIFFVSFIISILKRKNIYLNNILIKKNQISFVIHDKTYVLNKDNTILSMNKNGLFIKNPADQIELFFSKKIIKHLQSIHNNDAVLSGENMSWIFESVVSLNAWPETD